MYFVIEGQDGTGKTTQAEKLADFLRLLGKTVVTYSESGTGTKDKFISEIAKLAYQTKHEISDKTMVLLYLINRYEQWLKIAEPCLSNGGTVIVTRSWISTLIYEGYGGTVPRDLIEQIHREIMPKKYFQPDKQVILTLSQQERLNRLKKQAGYRKTEFFKSKETKFQEKIAKAYLQIADEMKIPIIDANGDKEEVFKKIQAVFSADT